MPKDKKLFRHQMQFIKAAQDCRNGQKLVINPLPDRSSKNRLYQIYQTIKSMGKIDD